MSSLLTVFPCRDRGCKCNWKIIPRRHADCNCNRQLIAEKKRTACINYCRNGTNFWLCFTLNVVKKVTRTVIARKSGTLICEPLNTYPALPMPPPTTRQGTFSVSQEANTRPDNNRNIRTHQTLRNQTLRTHPANSQSSHMELTESAHGKPQKG